MSSVKFKNPGEQHVRIALLSGQIGDFPPGEIVEVPETMKADCLAANLTLVSEKKSTAKPAKPEAPVVDGDDNESTVNAG